MLMRHAKSDWDVSFRSDHDRPLAARGERSARAMGEALRRWGEVPERIVSSTAVRAESTAELARLAGGWSCPLVLDGDLYGASPADVMTVAARHGGDVERLMLVGHEPTWSALVTLLTGARASVKTGTVAAIDLDVAGWDGAADARGTLAFLVHPRLVLKGREA